MSKSVFEDLGFSKQKSKDLELRTVLIDGILKTVEKHSYSSKDIQKILAQPQSEISYLLSGKISRFSSDKLIKFLGLLQVKVDIKVKIPRKRIEVA